MKQEEVEFTEFGNDYNVDIVIKSIDGDIRCGIFRNLSLKQAEEIADKITNDLCNIVGFYGTEIWNSGLKGVLAFYKTNDSVENRFDKLKRKTAIMKEGSKNCKKCQKELNKIQEIFLKNRHFILSAVLFKCLYYGVVFKLTYFEKFSLNDQNSKSIMTLYQHKCQNSGTFYKNIVA